MKVSTAGLIVGAGTIGVLGGGITSVVEFQKHKQHPNDDQSVTIAYSAATVAGLSLVPVGFGAYKLYDARSKKSSATPTRGNTELAKDERPLINSQTTENVSRSDAPTSTGVSDTARRLPLPNETKERTRTNPETTAVFSDISQQEAVLEREVDTLKTKVNRFVENIENETRKLAEKDGKRKQYIGRLHTLFTDKASEIRDLEYERLLLSASLAEFNKIDDTGDLETWNTYNAIKADRNLSLQERRAEFSAHLASREKTPQNIDARVNTAFPDLHSDILQKFDTEADEEVYGEIFSDLRTFQRKTYNLDDRLRRIQALRPNAKVERLEEVSTKEKSELIDKARREEDTIAREYHDLQQTVRELKATIDKQRMPGRHTSSLQEHRASIDKAWRQYRNLLDRKTCLDGLNIFDDTSVSWRKWKRAEELLRSNMTSEQKRESYRTYLWNERHLDISQNADKMTDLEKAFDDDEKEVNEKFVLDPHVFPLHSIVDIQRKIHELDNELQSKGNAYSLHLERKDIDDRVRFYKAKSQKSEKPWLHKF